MRKRIALYTGSAALCAAIAFSVSPSTGGAAAPVRQTRNIPRLLPEANSGYARPIYQPNYQPTTAPRWYQSRTRQQPQTAAPRVLPRYRSASAIQQPAVQQPAIQQPAIQQPAIQQTANQQAVNRQAAPETAIQRQLRLLYQKNGKQMPNMNLQTLPANQLQRRARTVAQQPQQQPPKKPSFFQRIFPFGRKKRTAQPQPNHLQSQQKQQLPRRFGKFPWSRRSQPTPVQQQPRQVRQLPQQRIPVQPQVRLQPQAPVQYPQAAQYRQAQPIAQPSISAQPSASLEAPLPSLNETTPRAQQRIPTTQEANEFANPFPEGSEAEADHVQPKRQPAQPKLEIKPETPYSGIKISTDPVPVSPESIQQPVPQPEHSAPKLEQVPESQPSHQPGRVTLQAEPEEQEIEITPPELNSPPLSKKDRIAARKGLLGFRGFCPVVLRDHRDLVDVRQDFQSVYNGQLYYFSSAAAKSVFDLEPKRYAPAKSGCDIVLTVATQKRQIGSIEHAAWFRGQLYLFTNADTLKQFSQNPKKYVP